METTKIKAIAEDIESSGALKYFQIVSRERNDSEKAELVVVSYTIELSNNGYNINYDIVTSFVIYDDDTLFRLQDMNEPAPETLSVVDQYDWIEFHTNKTGIILNGLPRILC